MVNDKFNIRMIYPTTSNGDEWYINSSGSNVRGESVKTGSDSQGTYFYIDSDQVRAAAVGKFGYDQGKINQDHDEIDLNRGGTGHMQENGGWRDTEMGGHFWASNGSGDTEYVLYCRGGTHTSGRACEGTAYKAAVNYNDGRVRIRKEQYHVSYTVVCDWREGFGGSIRNKWVGFKFICVNKQRSGTPAKYDVYMEIWIDKQANNNWERVMTCTDSGGKGSAGGKCDGDRDQILTWSGPLPTFRWDITGVRFKNISVREIKMDGDFSNPPPPGGGGTTPPPSPGEDPFSRFVYPSTAIKASSDDGNVAANVNDLNMSTRWGAQVLPSTITVDLGAKKKLGYIRIFWYRSNERTYGYDIATSLTDSDYNIVKSGTSLSQNGFERYDFTDHNARFVRVYVNTNSGGNEAAILELECWGDNVPIGEEPLPGEEPQAPDPYFLYIKRKHRYNVNHSLEDLCGGT